MKLNHILLAGLTALSAPGAALAQTQTLDGVSSIGRSAISPIYAGNEVKGYILYAKADKADHNNDNYRLDFYDQDLTKVSSLSLQKPSGRYYLLANSFNGSAFALYFYNSKDGALEVETYDMGLKKLGTKSFDKLSKADIMSIAQTQQSTRSTTTPFGSLGLFSVPGYGFIRNSYEGMMKGVNLQMFDDKMNLKWTIAADPKSKYYESISLTEATGKYVLATMMRKEGMLSRKVESYLLAIDAATGKKVLELPVETSATEQLSLNSFTYDADKHEFVAMGEYYKLNDKPFVNKSEGFYIKRFSEEGKPVFTKSYSWQKDIKGALPADAQSSVENGFVNYPQAIVRGANGNTYMVAEQYKIVGNGAGIAMAALGGGASVVKGKIANMLVFALDPAYNLTGIKFYSKDESSASVPPGGAMVGSGVLGHYFRQTGQFDYQFLQKNDANSQFNIVYINYDKEKGEKTKKVIGNVAFTDSGQFKFDKIDATNSATASYLYPAKPGYLMMVDYLKKENKVGMKLVKLNI